MFYWTILVWDMARTYYVYILASRSRTLCIGVTSNLEGRINQHRDGKEGSFTKKYYATRLVYWEEFADIGCAILREKQLKKWKRAKKVSLIERYNPAWKDLAWG
jgi:putative endonuclease